MHAKVAASTIAGSITVVLVWGLQSAGIDVPPEVASAITTIISGLAGYLKT